MGERQLILVDLSGVAKPEEIIANVSTLRQLETLSHRLTDSVERDLMSRLCLYSQTDTQWAAQPKIKRIYKLTQQVPHSSAKSSHRKPKVKSLKGQ